MEITGEFPATDAWFGFDGMPASFKSAIVYYKTQNGGIAISTARQGHGEVAVEPSSQVDLSVFLILRGR
jgi:hypothetical protein